MICISFADAGSPTSFYDVNWVEVLRNVQVCWPVIWSIRCNRFVLECLDAFVLSKVYDGFLSDEISSTGFTYATVTLYHDVMALTYNLITALQPAILQQREFWLESIEPLSKSSIFFLFDVYNLHCDDVVKKKILILIFD